MLGPEQSRLFCYCYDVTPQGNWEGKNILNRVEDARAGGAGAGAVGSRSGRSPGRLPAKLFDSPRKRVHPGRDDKILAGWNGLMISACPRRGAVLGDEPRYTKAAARRRPTFC